MLRLGHLELVVRDPQASKAFYVDVLGFEVEDEQHGGRIVWLRLGDRALLLRPGTPPPPPASYQAARLGLVLFTDDLDAALARLQARGLVVRGDDGPGCPTFTDPDGNWIQLASPGHA